MTRITLPIDDWNLLLNPRFAHLDYLWQVSALALLGIVPLLLLFWLYRAELRLIRWPAAVLLLFMRVVAVALLWFVVCWQPVLARTESEQIPSRVIIAADISGSMDVADPHRSSKEKLQIAKALRISSDGAPAPESLIDRWITHYENNDRQTPVWATPQEEPDPAKRKVLAASRKKLHDELCAKVDALSRKEIVAAILSSRGLNLVERLKKQHHVDLFVFDERVSEETKPSLAPDKTSKSPALATDLSNPLSRTLEQATKNKGKLLGLVLLSDGIHNSESSPIDKAKELRGYKIPIFPVAVGSQVHPPDVSISEVVAPANVLLNTPSEISAQIQFAGIPNQDFVVELHEKGKPVAKEHQKVIKHDGKQDTPYSVQFPIRPAKKGVHALKVQVRPLQGKIKELSAENNAKPVILRVIEDKAKVLLIDNEARWEYHYLVNALLRDKSMEVDSVLFVQPRIDGISSDKLRQAKFAATELPKWDKKNKKPDPLMSYHAIVLGDVPPEHLPEEDQKRLADFVSRRGGTLVVLAGKNFMPLKYVDANTRGPKESSLIKLLPIRQPEIISRDDGFRLQMSYQGKSSPFLQLEDDPEESDRQWQKMPLHYWALTGRAHPGATVLASLKGDQKGSQKTVEPKGPSKDRENALLVLQNYGFGRVLYVGLDSTWRFRYRQGDYYHHRFWGQLMLWAASEQLLPAGNDFVRYGAKQPIYKAKETVEIFARLGQAAAELPPDTKITAKILQLDESGKESVFSTLPMNPDGTGQRQFKGSIDSLPAGKYRITLDIPGMKDQIDVPSSEPSDQQHRDTFVVTPVPSKEMTELAANVALLDRMAFESGNPQFSKALNLQQLDELVNRLDQQVAVRSRHREQKVWQDQPLAWYFLGAFLLLISVEWITRKFAGLP